MLVGFSPRMLTYDIETGAIKYQRWQHTWWSGLYSIVLTKGALFHKKYLQQYHKETPVKFLEHVDKNRNCEDIAMAHLIAKEVIKATFYSCFSLFS